MPERRPKPAAGRQKGLTRPQQSRLLQAAQDLGLRPFTAILWTLETGSRVTETCHARIEAIDAEGYVRVARLKKSNPVAVSLSDVLRAAVEQLADGRKRGYTFMGRSRCGCAGGHVHRRTVYHWTDTAGAKARLPIGLRHPHALRHSAIHNFAHGLQKQNLPQTVELAMLQAFSGHRDPQVLMQYMVDADAPLRQDAIMRQFYEDLVAGTVPA